MCPTNTKAYYEANKAKYYTSDKQNRKVKLRMRARYMLQKQGRVHKWDGKNVDHKDGNVNNNSPSNLRVVSEHLNKKLWALKTARIKRKKKGGYKTDQSGVSYWTQTY